MDASAMVIGLFLTLAFCAFFLVGLYRRYMTLRLRWPTKLDYYPFRRRLSQAITAFGFKVSVCPIVPFDLEANINGKVVLLICVPDNGSIVETKLKDWGEAKTYFGEGRQVVCVTGKPVHEAIAREAADRSLQLLHYKQLKDFLPVSLSCCGKLEGLFVLLERCSQKLNFSRRGNGNLR